MLLPDHPASGMGGIRTHVPVKANGFQDRLVMAASIPYHLWSSPWAGNRTRHDWILNEVFSGKCGSYQSSFFCAILSRPRKLHVQVALHNRDGEIRTHDPLTSNQVRCQVALHPWFVCSPAGYHPKKDHLADLFSNRILSKDPRRFNSLASGT